MEKDNSASASDSDIDLIGHSMPICEISIDDLLAQREKDREENEIVIPPTAYNDSLSDTSEINENQYSEIESAFSMSSRDASIFDFTASDFPSEIFESLNIHSKPPPCIILLPWQMTIIKNHINNLSLISPNINILYALMYELVLHPSDSTGELAFKFARRFPDQTADFSIWFSYFSFAAIKNNHLPLPYFLSFASIPFFFSDPQSPEAIEVNSQLTCLFIASMLDSNVSQHPQFHNALIQLRHNLSYLPPESVSSIVSICFPLCRTYLEQLSTVLSDFPFIGAGSLIIHNLTYLLMTDILGHSEDFNSSQNSKEDLNYSEISEIIPKIKNLCEFDDDSNLVAASAVIALAENFLVSGIRIGTIGPDLANQIIESFRFSISSSDPSNFIELKEQLHVTRAHLEFLVSKLYSA